jgi:hypothetical protein
MEWNRDIVLLLINILILSICVLLLKKRNILGSYFYYMFATMIITYIIDSVTFFIRLSDYINKIYSLYIYIFGGLGIFFLIIFIMYQNLIKDNILKNIAKASTILYLFFYFYQIFTLKFSDGFPEIILFFNVFLLLFVISLFLLDTFKTDLILELSHYYPFWFSLGLIVIYLGIVPSIILSEISSETMTSGLWSFITFIINLLGYGILLVGLLKAKKVE